jgi:thiosulfate/3-mercaptopyruvate sulfurtransferase
MQNNCTACHGSRIGDEYLGKNAGIPGDIHWTKQGMTCNDCHGDKIHGTGEIVADRYHTVSAQCEDCHQEVWTNIEGNPQHEQHVGELSCYVCHATTYKNCYSCHVALSKEGIPYRNSEPSELQFKIGQNPIRSRENPYKYVVLRHPPTNPNIFDYYGEDLLPDFDALPTWKYATPHNIQLHTAQNESCESCHGNEAIFLTEDDLKIDEVKANQNVVVPEIPNPLP